MIGFDSPHNRGGIIYQPVTHTWIGCDQGKIQSNLTSLYDFATSSRQNIACHKMTINVSRPHDPHKGKEAENFRNIITPLVHSEKHTGSAACSFILLATGKIDAYISFDLPLWDTFVGHAIITALGGEILVFPTSYGTPVSIASSQDKAHALFDLIQTSGFLEI